MACAQSDAKDLESKIFCVTAVEPKIFTFFTSIVGASVRRCVGASMRYECEWFQYQSL
jgi:hypothetical protein